MSVKIEKNVPIPSFGGKYLFMKDMEIGDSVLLPSSDKNNFYTYAKLHGIKIKIKTTSEGTRIWRIA